MSGYIVAIDQGTTSSRTLVFDDNQSVLAVSQQEFPQHFPASGWVEHDPEEIWRSVLNTFHSALSKAGVEPHEIAGIGITNQRETTVLWDRVTGKPVANALVWQDRRTADICARLKAEGREKSITARTGLLLDPYFSGTKIKWLLDNVPGAREAAQSGKLAFGTVDSFLLWRLTGGKVHATDATNASRTMLFNITNNQWDNELLDLLDVPASVLPEVLDCNARFGETAFDVAGAEIPILGIAGDQHAATMGQACFKPGMTKSTYGTGCFALLNTGETLVESHNRLLGTIAYRIDGKTTYALEGSIFVAGAAVQWLRDGLGVLDRASHSAKMAEQADATQDVYMVPSFTGLGAPYWDAQARGAIYGITRNTGPNEIAKAALESVGYQTRDLLDAMKADWQSREGLENVLRVDGGMTASDWTMQFLADMLGAPVQRPANLETTALGAAWLAGSNAGIWPGQEEFSRNWRSQREFLPEMASSERERKYSGWLDCVERTRSK